MRIKSVNYCIQSFKCVFPNLYFLILHYVDEFGNNLSFCELVIILFCQSFDMPDCESFQFGWTVETFEVERNDTGHQLVVSDKLL